MFPVPSTFAGSCDGIAVLVLLSEFAMLRAPLLRSQVRLYIFQSLSVAVLAAIVAGTRHIGDLYALAVFSFALKVVIVPAIMLRLLRGADADLAASTSIGGASMVLIAIVVSGFGLFSIDALHIHSATLPTTALAIAVASVLVSFVLIILRSDVVSQAIGFFSLENGVSLAGLVVATKLPLIGELGFLFDLLVAVVVFGVLIRVHHGRSQSLSTDELDRLRG
jgi:hydrogenase-4 component E